MRKAPWSRDFFRGKGDLYLGAILVFSAVHFFSGYFTPVHFRRERIAVSVAGDRVRVTGLYEYTNDSALPAVLALGIPFPIDAEHPAPEWVLLAEVTREGTTIQELIPLGDVEGMRLRLVFRPKESKWIRLDYQQPAYVRNGRYLLTTTRAWRRPIEQADFSLRLPASLELTDSNYPLQPASAGFPGRSYLFRAIDFYPDRDWVFAWREAPVGSALQQGAP